MSDWEVSRPRPPRPTGAQIDEQLDLLNFTRDTHKQMQRQGTFTREQLIACDAEFGQIYGWFQARNVAICLDPALDAYRLGTLLE